MFNGTCEEAFTLYKDVFDVKDFDMVMRFSDMPKSSDMKVEEEEKNNIMHMSISVSPDFKLMGSDVPTAQKSTLVTGSSTAIAICLKDSAKTEEVFKKLSEGGTVIMPLANQFWGSLYGKCQDKFGIHWHVDCELNENKKQKTEETTETKNTEDASEAMDTTEEAKVESNENGEAKDGGEAEEAKPENGEAKVETEEAKAETGENGESKAE